VAGIHSDFFQGQTDRAYSVGLTIPGQLGSPSKEKRKTYLMVGKKEHYIKH
jgi:hypothetical protein